MITDIKKLLVLATKKTIISMFPKKLGKEDMRYLFYYENYLRNEIEEIEIESFKNMVQYITYEQSIDYITNIIFNGDVAPTRYTILETETIMNEIIRECFCGVGEFLKNSSITYNLGNFDLMILYIIIKNLDLAQIEDLEGYSDFIMTIYKKITGKNDLKDYQVEYLIERYYNL